MTTPDLIAYYLALIGTIWWFLIMIITFISTKTNKINDLSDNFFVINYVISFSIGWSGWFCLIAL